MRIDTHHHLVPPDYRKALVEAGLDLDDDAGLTYPEWSIDTALEMMAALDVDTAVMSVSTPGTTFLSEAADAAAIAGQS